MKKGLILTLISHLNKKLLPLFTHNKHSQKKRKYIYLFFLKKTLVNYNFELPRQTPLMYYIKNNLVTIIRTHLSNYKEKNDGHVRQRRAIFLVN
jgi:hypothetical protein